MIISMILYLKKSQKTKSKNDKLQYEGVHSFMCPSESVHTSSGWDGVFHRRPVGRRSGSVVRGGSSPFS